MSLLWGEVHAAPWNGHLAEADARIEAVEKPMLAQLDSWRTQDLPAIVKARHEAHLIKDEVVRLVEWKLTRGTWRPRLLDYAKNAPEGSVVAATKSAYTVLKRPEDPALQDVQNAIKELTCLKGVGPATASAMLTVFTPSLPFMSDEALAAALPGRPEYTVKQYIQLVEALRNKADALSCASGSVWTAAQVERALWSESLAQQASKSTAKGTKRKR